MAVASFGLVQVVEELFFRGYVHTRLTETSGAPAAIVMTALLFTLSHRQYFIPSILGAGMLISLFIGSLLASYVRHRFKVLLVSTAVVMTLARRALRLHPHELAAFLGARAALVGSFITVGVVVVVLLVAAPGRTALLLFGGFALTIAIVLARNGRQREVPATPAAR